MFSKKLELSKQRDNSIQSKIAREFFGISVTKPGPAKLRTDKTNPATSLIH